MPRCKCCAKMLVGGGCTEELEDAEIDPALDGPIISIEMKQYYKLY